MRRSKFNVRLPLKELFDHLRKTLLSNDYIYGVNALWKSWRLKNKVGKLSKFYERKIKEDNYTYSLPAALEQLKKSKEYNAFNSRRSEKVNILWVGANKDQDEAGFLQALHNIGEVHEFSNVYGSYGLWYRDELGEVRVYDKAIIALNDSQLISTVSLLHAERRIDLVMGQMWANYVSAECLRKIQDMGILVINISMDDRLPENWSYKSGCRLGSIGLATGLNFVLTTSSECCEWYGVEGVPAMYWPLASDATTFAPNVNQIRDIDVLFIGNRYGVRGRIIAELSGFGINVTCYGAGWDNGPATAEQSSMLFKRAKIILGIGTIGHCEDLFTMKLRDFDAPMSGALYITHRTPDLSNLYKEGREIECYSTVEEAAEKIAFYLKNSDARQLIGMNGLKKALSRDTWNKRLSDTFSTLGLTPN